MKCPKCKSSFPSAFITKYLPLIDVPNYAEFQPAEKLTLCRVCGFAGKHKLEMLDRSPLNAEFWTELELKQMKKN